ncbi:MAG: glycosyltransferase, partial [Candidatus Omnitrophica bacterium]|nr:glycosyltransferase [Candidatus Omnitrophota bacterium]
LKAILKASIHDIGHDELALGILRKLSPASWREIVSHEQFKWHVPGLMAFGPGIITKKAIKKIEKELGIEPQSLQERAENVRLSLDAVRKISAPLKIAMTMPIYNESIALEPSGEDAFRKKILELEELRETNPDNFSWQLIIVDDASTDDSVAVIKKLWSQMCEERNFDPSLVVIKQIKPEEKKGKKGGAVHLGMEYALHETDADYIGYYDVDSSIHRQIGLLIKPLYDNKADVALGSRWVSGASREDMLFMAKLSSRIYNWCVRLILWFLWKIRDTQRGFKLFIREVLSEILWLAKDNTLAFDTELLLLAKPVAHYRLKEVGISWIESPSPRTFSMTKEAPKMLRRVLAQRRAMGSMKHRLALSKKSVLPDSALHKLGRICSAIARWLFLSALVLATIFILEYALGVDMGDGKYYLAALFPFVPRRSETSGTYAEMFATHRHKILTDEMIARLKDAPQAFFNDFLESMPPEHRRRASMDRIINETAYAYMYMAGRYGEADEGAHYVYIYNPTDAAHTEVIVFGNEYPGYFNDITSIFVQTDGDSVVIDSDPQWGCAMDSEPRQSVYVYEITNDFSKKPLTEEEISELEAAFSNKEYIPVNCADILDSDTELKVLLEDVNQKIKAAIVTEIAVPSITSHDVEFLTVRKVEAFVNHLTIIDQDIWTEKDTIRQRELKIAAHREHMDEFFTQTLPDSLISDVSKARIQEMVEDAYRQLERKGKNALFMFDRAMTEYISALRENQQHEDVELCNGFLSMLNAYIDSFTYLDSDNDVAEEIVNLHAVADALKQSFSNKINEAQTEAAASAIEVLLFIIDNEVTHLETFVKEKKRKAYIELKRKIQQEYGPQAESFMEQIVNIRRECPHTREGNEEYQKRVQMLEGMLDGYGAMTEMLRMLHNYGHAMPESSQCIETEKRRVEEVLSEIRGSISPDMLEEANSFLNVLKEKACDAITPGGCTASHIVRNLADSYIGEHPEESVVVNYISSLFTYLLEGPKIPVYSEDEQARTIYVTNSMDQLFFYDFIEKNPNIRAIVTKCGNSRSHWVITAKDMLMPGRKKGIIIIPGVPEAELLNTGDQVIVDGGRQHILVNTDANPDLMSHYMNIIAENRASDVIYDKHSSEEAATTDGYAMRFLSDIPRVSPDASLITGFGASGIGLVRLENMYMRKEEPTEDDIAKAALEASDASEGMVAFRTLDMEKDKLVDMVSIKDAVREGTVDASEERPVEGVLFYFEHPKGIEIIRKEIRALARAYAQSKRKNLRITIPMVENEEQAYALKDLVRGNSERGKKGIIPELIEEGIPQADIEAIKFGAMIETPNACNSVEAILELGFFDYISIGTNDLAKRSFAESMDRNDERLEPAYHGIYPPFMRNVDNAVRQANEFNSKQDEENRIEIIACGELSNSRKFLFYLNGLMQKYDHIAITPVCSSYSIGELKTYLRNVSMKECFEAIGERDVNEALRNLVEDVSMRISKKHGLPALGAEIIKQMVSSSTLACFPIWAGFETNLFSAAKPFTKIPFMTNEAGAVVAALAILAVLAGTVILYFYKKAEKERFAGAKRKTAMGAFILMLLTLTLMRLVSFTVRIIMETLFLPATIVKHVRRSALPLTVIGIPKGHLNLIRGVTEESILSSIKNIAGNKNVEVVFLDGQEKDRWLKKLEEKARYYKISRRGPCFMALLDLSDADFAMDTEEGKEIIRKIIDSAKPQLFFALTHEARKRMTREELVEFALLRSSIEEVGLNKKSLYQMRAAELY